MKGKNKQRTHPLAPGGALPPLFAKRGGLSASLQGGEYQK